MIEVDFRPPICLPARTLISKYFKFLPLLMPRKARRLKLQVEVLPLEAIGYINPKNDLLEFAYGLFLYPPPLKIFLAGKADEEEDKTDWLVSLRDTICHEWAHYEQYARKVRVQERGVKVRTRNLIRKVESLISHESALPL